MKALGFTIIKPILTKKADFKFYNKDLWCIRTNIKSQVFDLYKKMQLRHLEKISKMKLLEELERTNWENANEKILNLRGRIKNGVKLFCLDAKNALNAKNDNNHSQYAYFTPDLNLLSTSQ